MSAQAGVWNFDGKPVDESFLAKLSLAIEPYGPDLGNVYINGSIALVYRAFHTTLESRIECQPQFASRGDVITWDGRLDNRDELIPLLWDETKANQTDVAIVGAAFERWGTDCFRRLVGDWAVSIWRPLEREILFACDYMAIRHIFYYAKKDRIWWSTDLSPLVLLSGDEFHIEDDYIAGYFAHDPDAQLTPYREIREVPPGQFVRVGNNGIVSVHRYWSFGPKSQIRYKTDAEYEEHFRQLFRQAVSRRLRTDTPVLAELSGGLDSSSIVCIADDILAKEGALAPRVDTLSYYDKTEPNGDDWIYFRKIEEKRGRIGAHIDASKMGSSSASFEYPKFWALPGYFGAARQLEVERADIVRAHGYRVVLSGIGGDEFTGGIPDPRAQLADLIVRFKFVQLAKQLVAWSLIKRRPWIQLLWQASIDLLPNFVGQYILKEAEIERWIEKDFAKRTKLALRLLGPQEALGVWLPTRRSYMSGIMAMSKKMAKWYVPTLALEEIRYPYLDQNLIELIASIPASQLLRPGQRRSLMRRALAGVVPQEILARRTKQFGTRTPVVALERSWEGLQVPFESPLSSSLGFINKARFLEVLNATRNGKEHHLVRLVRAISLEFWLRDLVSRRLIDGAPFSRASVLAGSPHVGARALTTISTTPASRVADYSKKGGQNHDVHKTDSRNSRPS